MGEYSKTNRKMGTCERMYYLRLRDLGTHRANPDYNSLNPNDLYEKLWFRLPFPDEIDNFDDKCFNEYNRGVDCLITFNGEKVTAKLEAISVKNNKPQWLIKLNDKFYRCEYDQTEFSEYINFLKSIPLPLLNEIRKDFKTKNIRIPIIKSNACSFVLQQLDSNIDVSVSETINTAVEIFKVNKEELEDEVNNYF